MDINLRSGLLLFDSLCMCECHILSSCTNMYEYDVVSVGEFNHYFPLINLYSSYMHYTFINASFFFSPICSTKNTKRMDKFKKGQTTVM